MYNSYFGFPLPMSLMKNIGYAYRFIHMMYAVEFYRGIYSLPVLLSLRKYILLLNGQKQRETDFHNHDFLVENSLHEINLIFL